MLALRLVIPQPTCIINRLGIVSLSKHREQLPLEKSSFEGERGSSPEVKGNIPLSP